MTDAYSVRYSPAAREDLKDIYSYIAYSLKEGNTAAKQTNRIRKGIRSLDAMPERHRAVEWEPWASLGMRMMPVDNYVIYYLVDKERHTVTVVRVFYGGRNVEEIIKGEH